MPPRFSQGRILPKISTMPRKKTEAAAYLDIYKLVIEKNRLQQELQTMEQRRQQIHQRLAVLENQVTDLENSIPPLRENLPADAQVPVPASVAQSGNFETFLLDY